MVFDEATDFVLPEIPEELASAYVPKSTMMTAVVSLLAIVAVAVFLFVYVRKRQKGSMVALFGGLATYLVFYYFGVTVFINFLFMIPPLSAYADSLPVAIAVSTVLSGTLPILGRLLTMKMYQNRCIKLSDQLSIGLGLMSIEGLLSVVNLFLMLVSCLAIDKIGVGSMISGATSQEEYESLLASAYEILEYPTSSYFFSFATTSIYMLFHLATTVLLFAAFEGKENKTKYWFVMGGYTVLQLVKYLNQQAIINELAEFLIGAAVCGATVYFSMKIYQRHYKEEEYNEKKEAQKAKKPMPKFENLSKL